MTGLFDGVAGLLNGVLGAPVIHRSGGHPDRVVQGIFRAPPVEDSGDDGHVVLDVAPTLRLCRPDADLVLRGDTVIPGDGQSYTVHSRHPSGSPAADAFVIFVLERMT